MSYLVNEHFRSAGKVRTGNTEGLSPTAALSGNANSFFKAGSAGAGRMTTKSPSGQPEDSSCKQGGGSKVLNAKTGRQVESSAGRGKLSTIQEDQQLRDAARMHGSRAPSRRSNTIKREGAASAARTKPAHFAAWSSNNSVDAAGASP